MPRKPKPPDPKPSPARLNDAEPKARPGTGRSDPDADVERSGGDLQRADHPDEGKAERQGDIRIGPGGV